MDKTPKETSTPSGVTGKITYWFTRNWKITTGVLLVVGTICVAVVFALPSGRSTPHGVAEETYTLVRDKISKSAAIALALPEGVKMTPVEAVEKVTFEPA